MMMMMMMMMMVVLVVEKSGHLVPHDLCLFLLERKIIFYLNRSMLLGSLHPKGFQ